MDIAEMMYAAELYGDMPTRTGKINRSIRMFLESDNPEFEQDEIFCECGIDPDSLTEEELERINREVFG